VHLRTTACLFFHATDVSPQIEKKNKNQNPARAPFSRAVVRNYIVDIGVGGHMSHLYPGHQATKQLGATPISVSLRGVSSQHFGPISRSGTRLSLHEVLPMHQRTVEMETANITIALENIQIGPRDNDSDTWMLSKGQLPFEKKLSNQGRLSLRIRSSPGMKWVLKKQAARAAAAAECPKDILILTAPSIFKISTIR
jgi:hypothetical protein